MCVCVRARMSSVIYLHTEEHPLVSEGRSVSN